MSAGTYKRRRKVRSLGARTFAPDAACPRNDGEAERVKAERREAASAKADAALAEVVELFNDPERLPAMVGRCFIERRKGTDSPAWGWSLANQLRVLAHDTTDARGFRQWKATGRNVKKGARAFSILGPRTIKVKDEATGDDETRVVGWTCIPVFAIESTEGMPLHRDDFDPEFPGLLTIAEQLGVQVEYAPGSDAPEWSPLQDRCFGSYSPGTETVTLLTTSAATFLHELAHVAHGRILAREGKALVFEQVDPQGYAHQELVAEIAAAALCQVYDLQPVTGNAYRYVEHYAGAGNASKAAMRVLADVQRVMGELLEADLDIAPAATHEPALVAA